MSEENPSRDQDDGAKSDDDINIESSGIRIHNNVCDLQSSFELHRTSESLSQSLERLSAGLRIKRRQESQPALGHLPAKDCLRTRGYDQAGRCTVLSLDDDQATFDV